MRFYLRIAIAVTLILSLRVVPVFSQGGTATLAGKVADPSGLPIVGVNVQAVNEDTNMTYPTSTNEAGIYSLPTLLPGRYRILVEKDGFERVVRPDVVLHVADSISIDFTLQVGALTQTVTVEGGAPIVNTTSSTLGGLVQSNQIESLPLNGRNYINLTLMQPGITSMPNVGVGGSYTGTWYSSNGAPIRSNNFMLDGAIMQDQNNGSTANFAGRTLGIDGIQEYRVITNQFSAEYGLTMGSETVMVSKSGTNQFHGSMFEYLRNSDLDAANFFDKGVAANGFWRLPPFKRNNFGASGGGPIQKDKMFFYATYEGVRERLGTTVIDNVPAAGCRGAAGATITNAECPQLGTTASATIAPVVAPWLPLYPLPNLPLNQFTTPYAQPDNDNFGQIRVDRTFSTSDTLFGRYTIDDDDQTLATTFPEDFVVPRLTKHQYATISENHTFSTSLLNTFSVSFSRTSSMRVSPSDLVGPQYTMVGTEAMGTLAVGGLTTFGPNPKALVEAQNILTFSDDVSKTIGRHAIKFGALVNNYRQYGLRQNTRGGITFANMAGFLTGTPSQYTAPTTALNLDRTWQFYVLGFYLQDDWRVRSNLTVNAGLRYEPAPNYYDEVHGLDSTLVNPATDTAFTVGPYFQNPTWKNVSPRLGFAWDVMGDGKTALRGGGAMLYDLANLGNGIFNGVGAQPPFTFTSTVSGTPSFTLPFTFPTSAAGKSANSTQYNFRQARLFTENLTLERQLPFSMAISISYAGSRGIHLVSIDEANPNIAQIQANGLPLWAANTTRVNPAWTTISQMASNGDSIYHSLVVSVTKRISRGLQFQSSYTWAKLLDNTQGEQTVDSTASSAYPTDPYNSRFDRGPASFSVPQTYVFNAIYTLPSPKIQERFLAGLTSGWGMTGIFTAHSGFPFNPTENVERSRSGIGGGAAGIDRPNWNPSFTGPVIEGGPVQYFNPNAFILQPAGTLGNVARDSMLGPGFAELDFALRKDTKLNWLGEGGNLEFRTEFFNILNHPNFAMPNNAVFAGTVADVTEPALGTAGQITSTLGTSRQIEFSLRLAF